jgi:hypothetical protein
MAKCILRIVEESNSLYGFLSGVSRKSYVARVLGNVRADGKHSVLQLPGPLGYGGNKSEVERKAKEHLTSFGFTEIEVQHRQGNSVPSLL